MAAGGLPAVCLLFFDFCFPVQYSFCGGGREICYVVYYSIMKEYLLYSIQAIVIYKYIYFTL